MNLDYDRQLEAAISHELKALPALTAPPGLVARVMARIEQPSALPWYRQPWDLWPAKVRALSFVLLLGMFGGLCLGAWQLPRAETVAATTGHLAAWFSEFEFLWVTLRVLTDAVWLVAQKLGTGFIVACAMLATFSYFACIGLGTVLVRYARAWR